jgi:hypothetical protein
MAVANPTKPPDKILKADPGPEAVRKPNVQVEIAMMWSAA